MLTYNLTSIPNFQLALQLPQFIFIPTRNYLRVDLLSVF